MTTPTREQVIEWARESDIIDFRDEADDPHVKQMIDMLTHAVNKAHAAGRDRGLSEAKEVCEREAEGFGGIAAGPFATDFGKHTHNAMAAGAKNCAAAIDRARTAHKDN